MNMRLEPFLTAARKSADPHATRHITVSDCALDDVGPFVRAQCPDASIVICADLNTASIARDLEARLSHHGYRPRLLIFEPGQGHQDLVCDDKNIGSLAVYLRTDPNLLAIAVGAGTLNDIAKMASFQTERSYIAVPTAASMNGYTSTIAAVLQNGVKRTLACHQPIAIFADTRIVCEAPLHLNQAGFGDLLSKPFSNADWLLSHFVRDVHYDGAASAFLDAPFNQLLAHAKGIAIADPEAIERLLETLLLSGFSMALAGSSAPASGGEHLLSHYWDMEQHAHGDELRGLHGTQVGIATWTSALLYERLLALPAQDLLHAFVPRPTRPTFDEVQGSHPGLNDAICREVHAQFHAKQKAEPEQAAELRRLQSDWPRIRTALKASCLPAGRIEEALRDAGCAMKASDLGVDRAHFVRTVVHARQIRHRYVALDLLADLGLLAAWAEDVVDHIEGAHA